MKSNPNPPNYQLQDAAANAAMAHLEKTLRTYDARMLAALVTLDESMRREIVEICEDGIEKFQAASAGCAPAQNVIVGVGYVLRALEAWRKDGPLGTPEPPHKL